MIREVPQIGGYECVCGWEFSSAMAQSTPGGARATLDSHLAGGDVSSFPRPGDYKCADCGWLVTLSGQMSSRCGRCRSVVLKRIEKKADPERYVTSSGDHALLTWSEPSGFGVITWYRCSCGKVKFRDDEAGLVGPEAVWLRHVKADLAQTFQDYVTSISEEQAKKMMAQIAPNTIAEAVQKIRDLPNPMLERIANPPVVASGMRGLYEQPIMDPMGPPQKRTGKIPRYVRQTCDPTTDLQPRLEGSNDGMVWFPVTADGTLLQPWKTPTLNEGMRCWACRSTIISWMGVTSAGYRLAMHSDGFFVETCCEGVPTVRPMRRALTGIE
jgi:DNA-directed RNA polymerase subunit RPC12/RpoP